MMRARAPLFSLTLLALATSACSLRDLPAEETPAAAVAPSPVVVAEPAPAETCVPCAKPGATPRTRRLGKQSHVLPRTPGAAHERVRLRSSVPVPRRSWFQMVPAASSGEKS